MKVIGTDININSLVAITNVKDINDSCLNGTIGHATHPFATGETKKGWIGILTNKMTPYGYKVNCYKNEVKVLNDEEIEKYEKYKSIYKEFNIWFDISLKEDKFLKNGKSDYAKIYGVVIAPINK